jgi:hypothetical protein
MTFKKKLYRKTGLKGHVSGGLGIKMSTQDSRENKNRPRMAWRGERTFASSPKIFFLAFQRYL